MILHVYHMKYGSLNADWDRQNFLSFWAIFCPSAPLWTQKIKILKQWKKNTCSYYHEYHEWQSYGVWFLRYGARRTFWTISFGTVFSLLPPPPLTTWKIKILKNEKTPGDIMLHKCTKNHDHMLLFFKIRCVTDVIFIFHFGLFFVLPLRHPTIQKIKI